MFGKLSESDLHASLSKWYQAAGAQSLWRKVGMEIDETLYKLPLRSTVRLGLESAPSALNIPEQQFDLLESCANGILPMEARTQDAVLMLHALDTSQSPHHLLREADRVLSESGYMLIVGFNRFSLWGALKWLLCWRGGMPWCCHFYSLSTLRDWLSLLNYDVQKSVTLNYSMTSPHMDGISKMDKIGKTLLPYFGNIYVLLAKKRTIPLNPVKMRWQQNTILPAGLKPSAETQSIHG